MGFSFNGLKAAVTISGTVATGLSQPSSTQTIVQKTATGTLTTGNTATLHTVTLNKTLYVQSLVITLSSGTGTGGVLEMQDDSTTVWKAIVLADVAAPKVYMTFPSPLKFSTNCKLLNSSGASILHATSITGFEA